MGNDKNCKNLRNAIEIFASLLKSSPISSMATVPNVQLVPNEAPLMEGLTVEDPAVANHVINFRNESNRKFW